MLTRMERTLSASSGETYQPADSCCELRLLVRHGDVALRGQVIDFLGSCVSVHNPRCLQDAEWFF